MMKLGGKVTDEEKKEHAYIGRYGTKYVYYSLETKTHWFGKTKAKDTQGYSNEGMQYRRKTLNNLPSRGQAFLNSKGEKYYFKKNDDFLIYFESEDGNYSYTAIAFYIVETLDEYKREILLEYNVVQTTKEYKIMSHEDKFRTALTTIKKFYSSYRSLKIEDIGNIVKGRVWDFKTDKFIKAIGLEIKYKAERKWGYGRSIEGVGFFPIYVAKSKSNIGFVYPESVENENYDKINVFTGNGDGFFIVDEILERRVDIIYPFRMIDLSDYNFKIDEEEEDV